MSLQRIYLFRHGVTPVNKGQMDTKRFGDHKVPLYLPDAREQALALGQRMGIDFFRNAMLYCSPYLRARDTLNFAMEGAGMPDGERKKRRIYFDPDLREVDHGYEDIDAQSDLRNAHGFFYYRYNGGESAADAYTRIGLFNHSLHRQVKRKKVTDVGIMAHGMTNRVFVTRWLHLTDEQFETLANPENCSVILIARKKLLKNPQFVCGSWGVEGLTFRSTDADGDERK